MTSLHETVEMPIALLAWWVCVTCTILGALLCSLRLLGSDALIRHGSLSKAGNIRWMHTFITIIETRYVNPAQGKAVLRQRTQMFDTHVPPPSRKRTKVLSTILHSGFTSGICISPYPQDSSGEIFWFPRQWNLKIIEKSSRGGSVEDGGDTVKRSCVGRARWWAHWREVCRGRETEQKHRERDSLCLFLRGCFFLICLQSIFIERAVASVFQNSTVTQRYPRLAHWSLSCFVRKTDYMFAQ